MLAELRTQMLRMGTVKIQFGIEAKYKNISEEEKTWIVSNKAVPYSPSFFADGIAKLNEKLSTFSEHSSGWMLVSIMELQLTLIKYEEIMHRQGQSYIVTPSGLASKHCVVNVNNEDNKCFLYSIAATQMYNMVPRRERANVASYQSAIDSYIFEEEWFPMKLNNIKKFEDANDLANNILQWKEDPIK